MPGWFNREDGTRLAWEEEGGGVSVVLVHGLGSDRSVWAPQVAALVSAGYRVLRLDLRGFGQSTTPLERYGLAEYLGDVEALADALARDRFHLVGHSLGGMLALAYATRHPERLLTLTVASTTAHNGRRASAFARAMVLFSERGLDAALADPALRPGLDAVMKEAFPFLPEPPYAMLRPGLASPDRSRANAWRACVDFTVKEELHRVQCPVFVTHGTADPLIPFRNGELIHEQLPHSEWHPEVGAGHSLPRSRAASFNARLVSFLSLS